MNFTEQLKLFFGPTVGGEELRALGRAAVAANARSLKLALAQRVWEARQRSAAGDQAGAAAQLEMARRLKGEYDAALDEYAALSDAGHVSVAGVDEREALSGAGAAV